MTVVPGQKGTAGIEEIPDPDIQDGALLVQPAPFATLSRLIFSREAQT